MQILSFWLVSPKATMNIGSLFSFFYFLETELPCVAQAGV